MTHKLMNKARRKAHSHRLMDKSSIKIQAKKH